VRLPPRSAARGFVVCLLALFLGALLNAEGLRKTAEIQPQGFRRHLAIDVARPLVHVSRFLHLSTPRHEVQVALGRQHWDDINTEVRLAIPAKKPRTLPAPKETTTTATVSAKHHRRRHVTPAPRYTAAHPLRVWVAGDSLAEVPGQGLERTAGRSLDIVGVESRLSTGLARPDLYNWFTRIPEAVHQLRAKIVVFSFGADDAHDYMTGVPAGETLGPLGSPSWDAEYRRRVDGVTRELAATGVYVVWLGLPIPDGLGFRHSFPIVNRILEEVAKAHPKSSMFVDTWHLLDDAHGRYTAYLRVHGKLTLIRLPDGVHYTAAGGDLVAAQVLKQLHSRFAF
jgi:uncharacterized protein